MLRQTFATAGLLASLAVPALAAPDTYTVDKQHTEAAFQVRHILTKVRGTFRDVDGTISWDKANPAKSSVEFRLKTVSVDTGVAQRDNHLRSQDFFWAEKYPEIVFVSTKIVPKSATAFDVTGNLTIRGVSKVVTLPVTYVGEQKDPLRQHEGRIRDRHHDRSEGLRAGVEQGSRSRRSAGRRPGRDHGEPRGRQERRASVDELSRLGGGHDDAALGVPPPARRLPCQVRSADPAIQAVQRGVIRVACQNQSRRPR